MKKPANFMTMTAPQLAGIMVDMVAWAADHPREADHFWDSFEYKPMVKLYESLEAAEEAGLLTEYKEYLDRMMAYQWAWSRFEDWDRGRTK